MEFFFSAYECHWVNKTSLSLYRYLDGDTTTSRNSKRQFRNCATMRWCAAARHQVQAAGGARHTTKMYRKITVNSPCPQSPVSPAFVHCVAFLLCSVFTSIYFIAVSVISIQINNHRWHRNRSASIFYRCHFSFSVSDVPCAHVNSFLFSATFHFTSTRLPSAFDIETDTSGKERIRRQQQKIEYCQFPNMSINFYLFY